MTSYRNAILAAGLVIAAGSTSVAKAAEAPSFYHLRSVLTLPSTTSSWDHLDYDQAKHLLFLARRADGLTVVNSVTGKVVAQVANAVGAGSTAIDPKLGRGYTANTDGSTSVFRLSNFAPVARISFGNNFDGVVYDPASNLLAYQQADNSRELLVDPATLKLVATVPVDGSTQLERPVPDGKGNLYLPTRDTSFLYKIDVHAHKIVAKWNLAPKCLEPSGIDYDPATNRLLVGCRGKQATPVLAVVDAANGNVTATYPIGRGVDDVVFDPESKQVFTANGLDSNMVIFKQRSADSYAMTQAFQTRPGARAVRYDDKTGKIYTMTADGALDPAKKNLAAISPFYPNVTIPNTFALLTYAQN